MFFLPGLAFNWRTPFPHHKARRAPEAGSSEGGKDASPQGHPLPDCSLLLPLRLVHCDNGYMTLQ